MKPIPERSSVHSVLKWFCLALLFVSQRAVADELLEDDRPLHLPIPGAHQLHILSPNLLELTLITTKEPDPAKVGQWSFVGADRTTHFPEPADFIVLGGRERIRIASIGFRRRAVYAPVARRDLRIGNYLYFQLDAPVADGQTIEVKNPDARWWPPEMRFTAVMDPLRFSPAIHVNQTGYLPGAPKKAMVGWFMGSLGELPVEGAAGASLVAAHSGVRVYDCKFKQRPDVGYEYVPRPYQKVLEADFSAFDTPGEYRLVVPGLGASFPFFIDEGVAAAFARDYALGLYHQRCGAKIELPFTRFVHDTCHAAPADIPTMQFTNTLRFIAEASADYARNPRHTAPQLKDFKSSLYPFVKQGKIDVSGGHHDAGDYSKYTINSSALVHTLVFAADSLPGVGDLDNLGLPESGDGKSDLLQEAKWEADFLTKMQDDDGGFYFLVYPRDRAYENNVLPDHGDPQVVWPKNTAATAAAVAALAQCASSPLFQRQFPGDSQRFLNAAKKGWAFLDRAMDRYGRDGAYQKLTHYGDEFMHDDELAWAACEMYLATGDESFHKRLLASFDPSKSSTRRWGWWRMYEGYGRAVRSYAFGNKSGRINSGQLDKSFLIKCELEIVAAAQDQLRWSRQSAYGTSFPTETKRFRGGGWYFSMDQAFDLAVACALDYPPMNDLRPDFLEALLANLNYEAGCNPVNVCYVTGLGWKRQHEIVHHYAMNDRRELPPSGLPLGNIQSGFMWLDHYKQELGALSFPSDGDQSAPYPIYDRWGDSFNVQTEFVVVNQARALAATAYLMARTPLKNQPWKSQSGTIRFERSGFQASGLRITATLDVPGFDQRTARIVWEAQDHEPLFGSSFSILVPKSGMSWVEAEAHWPDGRRVGVATNVSMRMLGPFQAVGSAGAK